MTHARVSFLLAFFFVLLNIFPRVFGFSSSVLNLCPLHVSFGLLFIDFYSFLYVTEIIFCRSKMYITLNWHSCRVYTSVSLSAFTLLLHNHYHCISRTFSSSQSGKKHQKTNSHGEKPQSWCRVLLVHVLYRLKDLGKGSANLFPFHTTVETLLEW